ncbi:MAG: hypothetical protein E7387_02520 [Ruminococcaceae bacterium]|nr:hypothetical protein [Oscillospiraceae bacterium]
MADKRLKPKKKNTKSYDNKLITWISVGLGAFVAVVIAIVLIITMTTGYIAKVDGLKIYDYEYTFFLQQAMYELQDEKFEEPEGFSDMSTEEQDELYKAFWTDEVKAEAAKNALEDARQFKAQYRLARDKGYKLTSDEKNNLKANITQYYNQYISYGYSAELVEAYFLGGMSLSEYKDFAVIQSTIEKYKTALKEDINPSDDELKAIYEENPDDYRTVGVRKFKIAIDVTKPTDDQAEDYQTKLDAYNKACDEAKKYAQEIIDTYNSGKTMNTYKKDSNGEYVLDDAGNKTVDKEALSFVDYVKAESDDSSSSSTGGLSEINNNAKDAVEEITDYALSMIWNADRTQIVKKDAESEPKTADNEESTEENTVMTDLEMIETETAIYVVRAESITDYENSKESEEGAADSIKDVIKAEVLEEKAVEKLEALVNEKGDDYKITSKKTDEIEELNKEIFSGI